MKNNKSNAKYSPTTNTVTIKAKSTDFNPDYLKYVFIRLKIPLNAKIVFTDKTFPKGITQWLNKN